MAKSSAFGFTNTTDNATTMTLKSLGLVTNYSLSSDQADNAVLNNKTAPIDVEEIVSLRSRDIQSVNTPLNIQYPGKVKAGIEYGVRVDATLSTTDSDDATFRVDEPIACVISFRHPKSGNITEAHVLALLDRAVSALHKDGTGAGWRISDLMRSAERPVTD
jgi:hypothetical protein